MSSSDIKATVNITYGIMTMIYLLLVGVMNTLSIRIYQEDVIIPYKTAKKAENIKENFGQEEELQTETKETSVIDKTAVAIVEAIMMTVTIPLAFGYIIGFDCSCPPDTNHVAKIVFCLGVFLPMIYIIVSEIVSLLIPDKDWLNPFLPSGSSKEDQDKHFFNKQYRKTFGWSLITLTFIIDPHLYIMLAVFVCVFVTPAHHRC